MYIYIHTYIHTYIYIYIHHVIFQLSPIYLQILKYIPQKSGGLHER